MCLFVNMCEARQSKRVCGCMRERCVHTRTNTVRIAGSEILQFASIDILYFGQSLKANTLNLPATNVTHANSERQNCTPTRLSPLLPLPAVLRTHARMLCFRVPFLRLVSVLWLGLRSQVGGPSLSFVRTKSRSFPWPPLSSLP